MPAPDRKARQGPGNLWAKICLQIPLCLYTCEKKKKKSLITNLCTTSAVLYFSPMTQSIHVKSSSFSKSISFYGNQHRVLPQGKGNAELWELYKTCALERLVLIAEGGAASQCQLPVLHALHHWHTQVGKTQNILLENLKDSSVSYQDVQKTTSWADYQ